MTEFNLRDVIREVCDASPATDPPTLAKEVARRIGRRDERAALEQALPILVQHVISRSRGGHTDTPGGQARAEAHSRSVTGGTSTKVAGIREAWRRALRDRVAVGPDRSDWKFLGDCTADDLDYAAAVREDHARRNAARAEQFRGLADALRESGVATVYDLPDLRDRFGDAA